MLIPAINSVLNHAAYGTSLVEEIRRVPLNFG